MFHSLRLSSTLDENHIWTIVIFCYRGEEEILPLTIEQARTTLPLANIHLFDDKADPIPGKLADPPRYNSGRQVVPDGLFIS